MREIKFRGKRADNGEWLEGYYQCLPNKNYASITGINAKGAMEGWRVIYETVGQFTGLHDKNGVEIYEGDVVLITEHYTQEVKETLGALVTMLMTRKYEVFWNKTKWSIRCLEEAVAIDPPVFDLPTENVTYEVIGNIHEGEQQCTSAIVE